MSKQHHRHHNQLGFSLLEQAMVLPFLLLIIAGAVDINSLMQGYSALQEGVNASLRCVYTTDGKCVTASPDSRPRLFNYYRVTRHPEFLVDMFNFQGTAKWINKPSFEYSNFRAQVLHHVEYEAQSANLSVARRYFPAERLGKYVLRTASLPYITGTGRNPNVHYRGARVGRPEAHSGSYPFVGISLGSINLITDSSDVSATLDFFIPNSNSNVFESIDFELPPSAVLNAGEFLSRADSESVNIGLHLTGNKEHTEIGAFGGIAILLQHYRPLHHDWEDVQDLGAQQLGRAPGEPTQANFVIRGLPSSFIDPSVPQYHELVAYSPLTVRYGERYRIRFTAHRDHGTVGWQGEQLKIFYPVEEQRSESFTCTGGMTVCAAAEACSTNAPASIFSEAPIIHTSAAPLRYDAPIQLAACSTGVSSISEMLSANNILECSDNFELRTEQGSCPVQTGSVSCPAIGTASTGSINYGLASSPDPDGYIHNSSQAEAICPPPTDGIVGPAQSPRWAITTSPVPPAHVKPGADGSFLFTKADCSSELTWPEGSLLQNYPKLTYTSTPRAPTPYYTGSVDPAALLADSGSDLNCPEFSLGSSTIDIAPGEATTENQDSLFYGSHVKPSCDWVAELKEDAVRFNLMDPNTFFEPQPILTSDKLRTETEPASCIDPTPEITWSEPDESILIPGGPFTETILPEACQEFGVSCTPEFIGFGAGATGSTSYDFEYASKHFGFNEVQAHYPRARWNCEEKDCVNIEVVRDGAFMTAQGGIKVPLFVLGRGTIELRYANRERREAEFSR